MGRGTEAGGQGGQRRRLWGGGMGLLPTQPSGAARHRACVWLQLALVCALTACPTTHTDAQGECISLVRQVCTCMRVYFG